MKFNNFFQNKKTNTEMNTENTENEAIENPVAENEINDNTTENQINDNLKTRSAMLFLMRHYRGETGLSSLLVSQRVA